tara:strand:+ start:55 stop:210 length:156 start_codon:yes stop_codon:yes gene_type:complete
MLGVEEMKKTTLNPRITGWEKLAIKSPKQQPCRTIKLILPIHPHTPPYIFS